MAILIVVKMFPSHPDAYYTFVLLSPSLPDACKVCKFKHISFSLGIKIVLMSIKVVIAQGENSEVFRQQVNLYIPYRSNNSNATKPGGL